MVIKPMIRSNICLNSHPAGCKKAVLDQIEYTKTRAAKRREGSLDALDSRSDNGRAEPKNVLVLGCSNGYGLASRIAAAFGYGAATIGVSLEKPGSETKWGTPGWYNNLAFDQAAKNEGLFSLTFDGDAFSHEIKEQVVKAAKENSIQFDLVVYSLASPVRVDPDTKVMYKSVLKPFGKPFSGRTIDPFAETLKDVTAEPATDEEASNTVKVMGGEDWELWIKKLLSENLLSENCVTVAYSYIGPKLSHAIYRHGTIGHAKDHLEKTAGELDAVLAKVNGSAYVSVNKGLVTRASAVIPVIPLYLASLFKVMKKDGSHEGCIEQINRLFDARLYGKPEGEAGRIAGLLKCRADKNNILVDEEKRIRIDDREMNPEVQAQVDTIMDSVDETSLAQKLDLDGYRHDFLATSGFDIAGVDYDADIPRFDVI